MLRSMSLAKTPPIVSIPSDNGVTSRGPSLTSPMTPPWIAAPVTTSSGFTDLFGSLLVQPSRFYSSWDAVEPPTRITPSISDKLKPASERGLANWNFGLFTKVTVKSSNLAESKSFPSKKRSASPAVIKWQEADLC